MELKIANDVLAEIDVAEGVKQLDPALVAILVQVISQVIIYIIQNCVLNKKTANSPNFIQRARLHLLVHRLGRTAGLDLEKREAVYDALIKKGAKATDADINEALAEAGKH